MRKSKGLWCFLSLCLSWVAAGAYGQSRHYHLDSVVIAADRQLDKEPKPSISLLSTLTSRIQFSPDIYVRQYGAGGLASASYRGFGASQLAVRWNGIPINSSVLGQADLNQYGLWPEDAVSLSASGHKLSTAGNLGTLDIDHDMPKQDTLIATLGGWAGSFGLYGMRGGVEVRRGQFAGYARAVHTGSQNDFPVRRYVSDPFLPDHQQHAAYALQAYQGGFQFRSAKYSTKLDVQYQQNNRQLATPYLSTGSLSNLEGAIAALAVRHELDATSNLHILLTHGLIYDYNRYTILTGGSESRYGSSGIPVVLEISHHIRPQLYLKGYADFIHYQGLGDAYLRSHSNAYGRGLVGGSWRYKQIKLMGWIGEGLCLGKGYLLYDAQMEANWQGSTRNTLHVVARSLFRPPTLNDRFYPQFGIANIGPELGNTAELRYEAVWTSVHTLAKVEGVIWGTYYERYLQWTPASGIYRPGQLQGVQGRGAGLEFNVRQENLIGGAAYLELGASGALNLVQQGKGAWHKSRQLIYSPPLSLCLRPGIGNEWARLAYAIRYTDARSVILDAREPGGRLRPYWYHEASVKLRATSRQSRYKIDLQVSILNVTNQKYETVANYASPPRSWQASVAITY